MYQKHPGEANELDDNSLLDFDTDRVVKAMESFLRGNLAMERARDLLSRSDFDFQDKIKSRMKGISQHTFVCFYFSPIFLLFC